LQEKYPIEFSALFCGKGEGRSGVDGREGTKKK
jgi:hypothetical protein